MIVLPKGAIIVERHQQEKKSIIIGVEKEELNTGTIIFTGPGLEEYQFSTIVFRENFSEPITVDSKNYLYFRDMESSMYYLLTNDNKK